MTRFAFYENLLSTTYFKMPSAAVVIGALRINSIDFTATTLIDFVFLSHSGWSKITTNTPTIPFSSQKDKQVPIEIQT